MITLEEYVRDIERLLKKHGLLNDSRSLRYVDELGEYLTDDAGEQYIFFDTEYIGKEDDYTELLTYFKQAVSGHNDFSIINSSIDFDTEKAAIEIEVNGQSYSAQWEQASDWVASEFFETTEKLNESLKGAIVALPLLDQCYRAVYISDQDDAAQLLEDFQVYASCYVEGTELSDTVDEYEDDDEVEEDTPLSFALTVTPALPAVTQDSLTQYSHLPSPSEDTISHQSYINDFAISPNGEWLVAGDSDACISIWNIETEALHYRLTGHTEHVTTIAFHPDGNTFASGSSSCDSTLKIWETETGKLLQSIGKLTDEECYDSPDSKTFYHLYFSPQGNTLIALYENHEDENSLQIYDTHGYQLVKEITLERKTEVIAINQDDSLLAFTFNPESYELPSELRLWCLNTHQLLNSYQHSTRDEGTLQFSENGQFIAFYDNHFRYRNIWDISSLTASTAQLADSFNSITAQISSPALSSFSSCAIHQNLLAINLNNSTEDGELIIWDLSQHQLNCRFISDTHDDYFDTGDTIRFSANQQFIIRDQANGEAKIWNIAQQKEVLDADEQQEILKHSQDQTGFSASNLSALALSPSQAWLVIAKGKEYSDESQQIVFWNFQSQSLTRVFTNTEYLSDIRFTEKEDYMIITSSSDKSEVQLWDLSSLEKIEDETERNDLLATHFGLSNKENNAQQKLTKLLVDKHKYDSENIIFHKELAIAYNFYDQLLTRWNVQTQEPISHYGYFSADEYSQSFSPDGNTLAIAGGRGISFWDIKQQQLIESWKLQSTIKHYNQGIKNITYYQDKKLIVHTYSGMIVIDIHSKEMDLVIEQPETYALNTETAQLAVVQRKERNYERVYVLAIYSLKTAECLREIELEEEFESLAFNADATYLVGSRNDVTFTVWNPSDLTITHQQSTGSQYCDNYNDHVFSDDGRFVISCQPWQSEIHIRKINALLARWKWSIVKRLEGSCMALSPDGKQLAIGDLTENYIEIWDAKKWKELHAFEIKNATMNSRSIEYSTNSQILSIIYDGKTQLYHAATGELISTLITGSRGHWASFDADGHLSCSGSKQMIAINEQGGNHG